MKTMSVGEDDNVDEHDDENDDCNEFKKAWRKQRWNVSWFNIYHVIQPLTWHNLLNQTLNSL